MPNYELQTALYPIEKRYWRTEAQLKAMLEKALATMQPPPEPTPEPKPKKTRKKKEVSAKMSE